MSLYTLLNHHGFIRHPFEYYTAEDEDRLDAWFVAPPFQNRILGYDQEKNRAPRPRSHVILGKIGAGKTAICMKVEKELLARAPRSLILPYKEFSEPLRLSGSDRPSISSHIEEILRLGTIGLIKFWTDLPDRYSRLGRIEKQELAGLIKHYYERLPPRTKRDYTNRVSSVRGAFAAAKNAQHTIIETYNATISIIKKEKIVPTKWDQEDSTDIEKGSPYFRLERFWWVAHALGVESIWILVDNVDADSRSRGDQIFNCVADLLLSQKIMEFRDEYGQQVICFQVFLSRPDYVLGFLEKEFFRRDRIETHIIDWKKEDLDTAFKKRLAYYSGNRIISFDQICDEGAQGAHDRLLDKCGLRPRVLFQMAKEILAEFDIKDKSGVTLIDKNSVEIGCEEGLAQCAWLNSVETR